MTSPNKDAYRRWYKKHGQEYNRSRRSRYATDPEYRKKVLLGSAKSRKRRRGVGSLGRIKELNGLKVYSTSYVCRILDIAPNTLRLWHNSGLVPEPSYIGSHRWYTEKQISILKKFRELKFNNSVKSDDSFTSLFSTW